MVDILQDYHNLLGSISAARQETAAGWQDLFPAENILEVVRALAHSARQAAPAGSAPQNPQAAQTPQPAQASQPVPAPDAAQCPQCGQPVSTRARFCSRCGAPIDSQCRQCGAGLTPGARFCTQCGRPVQP